ncbi:lipid-A-disaccharide synthase [Pantoea sp. Mhis]|uniref:lipid-A-disaccharide synthase n=1 Tax=Pantoea sp. Mhis TaxID=2576759 RepID=UPI001357F223|nr:lipid-A-disaccharide synthase [Pantoea sp. Mhis]MXP56361.1 lipid-A-disaccharide synthase [Pantoea sp. Mhis]
MLVRPLIIALVAGEISGDILGEGLIYALKARYPNTRFFGVAGPRMKAAGCETWYEMEELSVMGIIEVLNTLPRLLKIRLDLIQRFIDLKPDIFIGIDSPDFNLSLEGYLKKSGIRTIHYVSPSIWAWRKRRIFKIGRNTNLVLSCLPFEKKIYDQFNIPCRFIGHIMADEIPLEPNKLTIRRQLGITANSICIGLLPGSRSAELEMLSADFLYAAQILYKWHQSLTIMVPLVNLKLLKQFEIIKSYVTPDLPVHMLEGKSREVMIASDAVIIASGTATLECMLAKCPMVVGYRMNPLTFWLAKKLVKVPYISLPNLLAGSFLVKELLQDKCQPMALAIELNSLLCGSTKRNTLLKIFNELHHKIRCNANQQAANAVLEIINN